MVSDRSDTQYPEAHPKVVSNSWNAHYIGNYAADNLVQPVVVVENPDNLQRTVILDIEGQKNTGTGDVEQVKRFYEKETFAPLESKPYFGPAWQNETYDVWVGLFDLPEPGKPGWGDMISQGFVGQVTI